MSRELVKVGMKRRERRGAKNESTDTELYYTLKMPSDSIVLTIVMFESLLHYYI